MSVNQICDAQQQIQPVSMHVNCHCHWWVYVILSSEVGCGSLVKGPNLRVVDLHGARRNDMSAGCEYIYIYIVLYMCPFVAVHVGVDCFICKLFSGSVIFPSHCHSCDASAFQAPFKWQWGSHRA